MPYGLYKIYDLMERMSRVGDSRIDENMLDLLVERVYTLDEVYEKYYKNIPKEDFFQIVRSDPTSNMEKSKMGKYSKWLLWLYGNGHLKLEDLYKVTQYLATFHKYKSKLEKKDIGQYSSLPELYKAIQPFEDNSQAASHKEELRQIKSGAEKVYEDDEWLVVVPTTKEAAIEYGKGTQWCTAATESSNYFDYYNNKGKLYVNINKKNHRKFQIHFESGQFADETDEMVDNTVMQLSRGLIEFYKKINRPGMLKFMATSYSSEELRSEFKLCIEGGTSYRDIFDEIATYGKDRDIIVGTFCFEGDLDDMSLIFDPNGNLYIDDELFYVSRPNGVDNTILTVFFDDGYNFFNTETKQLIFNYQFDSVSDFQRGFARVECENGDQYMIRENGTFVNKVPYKFDDYTFKGTDSAWLIRVNQGDKKNLMNTEGELVSDTWYKEIAPKHKLDFDNCIVVNDEGLENVIAKESNWQPILKNWYHSVSYLYQSRWITVTNGIKCNICSIEGNALFDSFYFDEVEYIGDYGYNINMAKVTVNGQTTVLDLAREESYGDGKPHTSFWFNELKSNFSDGWAAIQKEGKENFINRNGELISEEWFDRVDEFANGYARVSYKNPTKVNFINTEGKLSFDEWFNGVYTNGTTKYETDQLNQQHDTKDWLIAEVMIDVPGDEGEGYRPNERNYFRALLNLKDGRVIKIPSVKRSANKSNF